MPKKLKFTDKEHVINVPLPHFEKGKYTVVSHGMAIDKLHEGLNNSGFKVMEEKFKCTSDGKICTGTLRIDVQDNEMGLMVGFINSYNKQVAFSYGIGSNIFVCDNMNILGSSYSNYKKRHIGNVDIEAFSSFEKECANLKEYFSKLQENRNNYKKTIFTEREMAELAGRLYVEEEILSANQLSVVKAEIRKPSFDYGTGNTTLWDMFNHCTHSAKLFHPKDFLKKSQELSDFFVDEYGQLLEEDSKLFV